MPDDGHYGPKHKVFVDDIIKSFLCFVYANINMSQHNGMDYIKIDRTSFNCLQSE